MKIKKLRIKNLQTRGWGFAPNLNFIVNTLFITSSHSLFAGSKITAAGDTEVIVECRLASCHLANAKCETVSPDKLRP